MGEEAIFGIADKSGGEGAVAQREDGRIRGAVFRFLNAHVLVEVIGEVGKIALLDVIDGLDVEVGVTAFLNEACDIAF